jgi:hypothetical protein
MIPNDGILQPYDLSAGPRVGWSRCRDGLAAADSGEWRERSEPALELSKSGLARLLLDPGRVNGMRSCWSRAAAGLQLVLG